MTALAILFLCFIGLSLITAFIEFHEATAVLAIITLSLGIALSICQLAS